MLNPYSKMRQGWIVLVVAVAATLGIARMMAPTRKALVLPLAPKGGISLQLAGSADQAQQVIDAWSHKGLTSTALENIRLDCLFIPAYTTLLAFILFTLADLLAAKARVVSKVLIVWGWAVWGAGILDYIEDFCDYRMIQHIATDGLAQTSRLCATVKFIITLGPFAMKVLQ
jgi:hypothetical protein